MKLTIEERICLKKWSGLPREILSLEEAKWSDFLWHGRHLYIKKSLIDDVVCGDEKTFESIGKALEYEAEIINKYRCDKDFVRCMVKPTSPNGNKEWEEITNNVGALRYLLYGEWDLSS